MNKMTEPDYLKMKRIIMGGNYSDCSHEYEIYKEKEISNFLGWKLGVFIVLKCKKCGDVTSRTLTI